MGILKFEIEYNNATVISLLKKIPELSGRYLSLIGKRARTILKENYLSGQELNLRAFPEDKIGRKTITSDVNKKRDTTRIYSYPVNLFEKGRRLRSGRKEPGKYIITKKLKQEVISGLSSYQREFETAIQNELKALGDS